MAVLRRTLSEDELRRADRFHFDTHRRRFLARRGVLRAILAEYLAREPRGLTFGYGPHGKSYLAAGSDERSPSFNLSSSQGLALLAVSRRQALGIDVERIGLSLPADDLAARFFSPCEREMLRGVPEELRARAFYACCTRKESYVKARGTGLALDLSCFDVSVDPREPARLIATHDDPADAARWTMGELDPDPDFAAALVVSGGPYRLWRGEW